MNNCLEGSKNQISTVWSATFANPQIYKKIHKFADLRFADLTCGPPTLYELQNSLVSAFKEASRHLKLFGAYTVEKSTNFIL